jgi:hypothetical protein
LNFKGNTDHRIRKLIINSPVELSKTGCLQIILNDKDKNCIAVSIIKLLSQIQKFKSSHSSHIILDIYDVILSTHIILTQAGFNIKKSKFDKKEAKNLPTDKLKEKLTNLSGIESIHDEKQLLEKLEEEHEHRTFLLNTIYLKDIKVDDLGSKSNMELQDQINSVNTKIPDEISKIVNRDFPNSHENLSENITDAINFIHNSKIIPPMTKKTRINFFSNMV